MCPTNVEHLAYLDMIARQLDALTVRFRDATPAQIAEIVRQANELTRLMHLGLETARTPPKD